MTTPDDPVGGQQWPSLPRKPEQASKVEVMDADPPAKRGRPRERGSNRHMHPFRSAGVVGTARRKGDAGNWGRPVRSGVAASTSLRAAVWGGSRTGSYDDEAG